MYKDEHKIGVVLISGDSFEIYSITKTGTYYENKKLYSDGVMPIKRHRKGGQSSGRFARIADEKEDAYIKMISEITIKCFMKDNNVIYLIDKLIIGGPGNKKYYLQENVLIQQYFKNNLIIMNTIELTDTNVHEALSNCYQYFENGYDNMISNIQKILTLNDDKLLFGIDEINNGIKNNTLQEIYISDELDGQLINIESIKCQKIVIPDIYFNKIGIHAIGIKWY